MYKLSTLLTVAALSLLAPAPPALHAQTLELNDVRNVRTAGSGAITRGDEVLGYFNMYQLDKQGGEATYSLQLLDADLNVLQKKRLTRDKGTVALGAKFNGEAICLTLINPRDRTVELLTYDTQGERLGSKKFELDRKAYTSMAMTYNWGEEDGAVTMVRPVDGGRGFVFYLPTHDKGIGYDLYMLPNSLRQREGGWKRASVAKRGKFQSAANLLASEQVILTTVLGVDSRMAPGKAVALLEARSTEDGNLLFTMVPGKSGLAVTNAVYEPATETVLLGGNYFGRGANVNKDRSEGVFLQRVDLAGEKLERARVSWDRAFAKVGRAETEHLKRGGSIYLHRVLPAADGGMVAVGEYYDQEVSALGVASQLMGGGSGGASVKKIVVQDLFALTFDGALEFADARMYPKAQSSVELPAGAAVVSPARLAAFVDLYDGFDYAYSQSVPDRDALLVAYTTRERQDGKMLRQPKLKLVTTYGDEADATEATVDLRTDATWVSYEPAKAGYVMVGEYHRKDKRMAYRLERVD